MDVYSTAAVPRGARASYWNDIYARRFAQVTFNPVDRESFEAELRVGSVGPIGIARVQSKPTDIERTRQHISRSDGRIFSFLLQARGVGLSGTFGGDSAVYRSRRGVERRLWQFTIILLVLFIVFCLAAFIFAPAGTTT